MPKQIVVLLALVLAGRLFAQTPIFHAQGEMTGEVTETSAILQSLLTSSQLLIEGNVPGTAGVGQFDYSLREMFPGQLGSASSSIPSEKIFKTLPRHLGLRPTLTTTSF